MPYQLGDTIAAVATALGGAARGIVRISGPDSLACAAAVFAPALPGSSRPTAFAGAIRLQAFASSVPATAYIWPTARSFTREPTVELHVPGSLPLVEAVLAAVCAAGARAAAPGEFTLRAFLSGRVDLTEAEAVLGVIDAARGEQLGAALAQLAGGLAGPLARLREALLELLAHLEAGLDFVEEDIEFIGRAELVAGLENAAAILSQLSGQLVGRHSAGSALKAVLVGWPNVGKSRLMNALAGREAALVSAHAGTTRDYLTARIDCQGVACELIDTAGVELAETLLDRAVGDSELPLPLGEGRGEGEAGSTLTHPHPHPLPEGEGTAAIEAAIRQAAQDLAGRERAAADLELLCLDASRPMNDWERDRVQRAGRRLVVLTKCDLPLRCEYAGPTIATSSLRGAGLDELRSAIAAAATQTASGAAVAATAARCGDSVRLAKESIDRALELARNGGGEELLAAEIRVALAEVAKMAGAVYTDDILDRIFSRFCIGK